MPFLPPYYVFISDINLLLNKYETLPNMKNDTFTRFSGSRQPTRANKNFDGITGQT